MGKAVWDDAGMYGVKASESEISGPEDLALFLHAKFNCLLVASRRDSLGLGE